MIIRMLTQLFSRRCSVKKTIFILFSLLVIRQVVNVYFLPRSQHARHIHGKTHTLKKYGARSEVDSSGQFRTRKFFVASEALVWDKVAEDDVTIVTHSSVSDLHHLVGMAERWEGPISVAVFSTDISLFASSVSNLRRCFPLVKQHVTFHLVTTIAPGKAEISNDETILKVPCGMVLHVTRNLEDESYSSDDNPAYPINILQNEALKGSITKYILTLNVDLMPNANLLKNFKLFTDAIEDDAAIQNVYILPDFEICDDDVHETPKYKSEVLDLWREGKDLIRPYRYAMCRSCHNHGNYTKWRQILPSATNTLDSSYEVEFRYPWQPFYISSRDVPLYDEGILIPASLSRATQLCELNIIGYKFMVLSDGFVVRRGFTTEIKPLEMGIENPQTKSQFKELEQILKERHPSSQNTCF
ncbi:beta-1,4-glucuronyltransferase 1-like [Saccoglossus kowalevskii]|uniref:Beta-1,4-glucuronyltransferase 1 n=1 Tax=Saccoglossus kowalevskii TaxID=10224 RepID=A0ABM0MK90_SACKO|nr:PREDICTED: N-acetyllactosaminide beta-1,3-N-acetylglucosaminyltransferase-like [Saccoglossus kowalevskii]